MNDLLSLSDLDFRKWLSKRLVVDRALEPTDELYEPLYENVAGDPVDLIYEDIVLSEVESLNFISGFRGSGKTTELFRLRKRLRGQGYFVAYANAMDFLLPSEPVEITDFLIVLAGAFSESIEQELGTDLAAEGFWTRFVNFLAKTDVKIDGIDSKANIPATDIGLNFKTSLKQQPSFRLQVRQKLATRLGELRREVHAFFEFGRKKIKDVKGIDRVVFLFDSLEQLRDPIGGEGHVTGSVRTLMAGHRADLRIPLIHMVFAVPPWLKFVLPDMSKIRLLYNVKLWKNNPNRTRESAGWDILRSVIERRFTPEGMQRYFGKPTKRGDFTQADKLIEASGGHFRDLLVLLRETLVRATTGLPISADVSEAAIASLKSSYLPIPLDDAQWLAEIGKKRDCLLPDRDAKSVQRMTFFLDTHCALILKNGVEWYDIHPLICDAVEEVLARSAAQPVVNVTQPPGNVVPPAGTATN